MNQYKEICMLQMGEQSSSVFDIGSVKKYKYPHINLICGFLEHVLQIQETNIADRCTEFVKE